MYPLTPLPTTCGPELVLFPLPRTEAVFCFQIPEPSGASSIACHPAAALLPMVASRAALYCLQAASVSIMMGFIFFLDLPNNKTYSFINPPQNIPNHLFRAGAST